jgi:CheY-like chemotaxis protein
LLVIEDHRDSRELLRQILEGAGAEVELADNGRTGLAVLDAHRPHVILCDLLMPEMDGLAFAQHVKVNPKWTRIPILAVTALGGAADYIRTWSHGFTGHLTKPIDASRLIAAVRRVARR